MDAGFPAVEENQVLDTVAGVKLYLLGRGVGDMFVVALYFPHQVGAGLGVRNQDFALLIGAVLAQAFSVPPDFKEDVGHDL